MGVFTSDEQIKSHLVDSLKMACESKSKLDDRSMMASAILNCYGMSGFRTRHFVNNLANVPGLKYAEVGTYLGSTLFSALYRNEITAVMCDNWSQFNGPREQFVENLNMYAVAAQSRVKQSIHMYEQDFEALELNEHWSGIDFYNFDGPHDEESQYKGIAKVFPALNERFLLFVDDWFWPPPRNGTLNALSDLNVEIICKVEANVEEEQLASEGHFSNRFEKSEWHNGIAVFACRKRS